MSNENAPPDPPPSVSAAELRRRLLASTPPPMASSSASISLPEEMIEAGNPASTYGRSAESLNKLKLPPQSTETPAPGTGSTPDTSSPIGRRPTVLGAKPPIPETGSGSGSRGLPSSHVVSGGSGPQGYASSRTASSAPPDSTSNEVRRLQSENKELRKLLDEMKFLLQEASDNEQQAAGREAELQEALEERQRLVDDLSAQLQAIEEQITNNAFAPKAPAPPKTRTELEEWSDDLEQESAKISQERNRLESERQQLREDEDALEHQMREMEVSMARERALMARQEVELKRLSAEIQHELDMVQRGDATLREQMQKFHRRASDVMQGRLGGGGPPPGGANPGRR